MNATITHLERSHAMDDSTTVLLGHKGTEVGTIPSDWNTQTLGAIGQCLIGLTYDPINVHPDGLLVLRSSNIGDDDLQFDDNVYVDVAVPERIIVRDGDLLICVRNGSQRLIGKCTLINSKAKGMTFGAFMAVFRSPYNSFVSYCFQSNLVKRQIHEHLGATINQITNKSFKSFRIPFPPPAEREAISEALSDVDGLLRVLEALIAKKRAIKLAATQQLLTGKTRLPGFSGKWVTRKIAEVASPCSDKNSLATNLPVLSCSKHLGFVDSLGYFKNQVFSSDLSIYKLIKHGEIGYPANHIEEGSIGLQDLYDVALVSPIYVVCSPKEGVNSYFLHRLLKLDSYRQAFATATTSSIDRRGSLRWPALSDIPVTLPGFEEQTAIATVLSDMDAEIAGLTRRRDKTRAIKQGMMQQLLTGRVRLVTPSLTEASA